MSHCEGNKSHGLDRFIFSFLKKLWNLIIDDLWIIFDQFNYFESLPCSFASYFVT